MINLLPPQYKKELVRAQNERMAVILAALILLFLLIFTLVLLSIKIYTGGQVVFRKAVILAVQKQAQTTEIEDIQRKIQSANQVFSMLDSFYEQNFYFTESIERISEILPTGVFLYNLSFAKAPQKFEIQVSLSGFASTRETLFELKKVLEAETNLKEIYFPPSNWVRAENIDFAANFKIIK